MSYLINHAKIIITFIKWLIYYYLNVVCESMLLLSEMRREGQRREEERMERGKKKNPDHNISNDLIGIATQWNEKKNNINSVIINVKRRQIMSSYQSNHIFGISINITSSIGVGIIWSIVSVRVCVVNDTNDKRFNFINFLEYLECQIEIAICPTYW